ncbi:MAG: ABC transporter ATP-binding protein [Lachnospiraceae bacterium]|nr:ABC transporter ATP-binding protein [Lachnospiraceae bacterium]
MFRVFRYLRKRDVLFILASFVFTGLQVFLELLIPGYMSEITTILSSGQQDMGEILKAGGSMLLCAFGSLVVAIMVGYCSTMVATGFTMRLRSKIYEKVTGFSMEEINGFSTASLITRSTNDIVQVQMLLVMGMGILFRSVLMSVMAILNIYSKSWQWTFSTGVAVLLLVTIILTLVVIVLPKFRKIQTLTDNLNRVTRENLTGIRVVRAYNAEKFQQGKFEEANDDLTNTHLFVGRSMAFLNPGMSIIMSGLSLSIYWIGAYLISRAGAVETKITLFSDMVVFSSYAMQVVMSFMMLTMIFIILPRAAVSARRIMEVMDRKSKITDGTVTEGVEGVREVTFENVSFSYPDAGEEVLSDISFTAKRGETVAFIGSTGSGKSTLINLVLRFFDATKGRVLVDGVDVKDYNLTALRNKIGLVPQRAILFGGTIRSNVAYGEKGDNREYTDEDVKEALRIAQAEEFVSKLENGLDAHVAQGGTNFSGGQKQRLSIARAICRKPDIYIFDDSFSALDYKTDRILRGELKKVTGDSITLLVAQRIGTIMDADQIIVLDDGKVAGKGTHKELLAGCEVYRQIAYSQLSKEELE